jgi:hypothetical protein
LSARLPLLALKCKLKLPLSKEIADLEVVYQTFCCLKTDISDLDVEIEKKPGLAEN